MKRADEIIEFKVHRDYINREAQHFKDHKKGLPEWIKNSDDSYSRHEDIEGVDLENAKIILNLGEKEISCLDFGGDEFKKIEKHLFYWGDPKAATHGNKLKKKVVSGGHGNGGKYYALSEFKQCKIINYYKGRLSVFNIQEEFDSIEIKNEIATPMEAIKEVGLHKWSYFEKENKKLFEKIYFGELNFFCWKGIEPKDKSTLSKRRRINLLLSSISNNPQSRSALRFRDLDALYNGKLLWRGMRPEEIVRDKNFGIKEFALPNEINGYKFNTNFNSTLKVALSKTPLNGEKSSLNILEIDAFQKNIACYHMPDLMTDKGLSKSLVAHIDCPELKKYKCVSNDRVNLIETDVSLVFLNWCRSKIREVLKELTDKEKKKEEENNLDKLGEFIDSITDEISELLEEDNLIKPKFSAIGEDKAIVDSPTKKEGFGSDGKIKNKGSGKRNGGTEKKEDTSKNKRGKSRIRILLSNKHKGPDGQIYDMVERQEVLEQRVQDLDYGIWWLNTQKRYVRKLNIEKNPELSKIFILFLMKEAILAHKMVRAFKNQERYSPDDLHVENMNLIDKIFTKTIDRLGIEISVETNMAKKIRDSIKNKKSFTIQYIIDETGADSYTIHSFLANESNHIKDNYFVIKQRGGGKKGTNIINVYKRK